MRPSQSKSFSHSHHWLGAGRDSCLHGLYQALHKLKGPKARSIVIDKLLWQSKIFYYRSAGMAGGLIFKAFDHQEM